MMSESMRLFREETTSSSKARLDGSVVLRQSASTTLVLVAIVLIACAITIWVVFGSYSRIEPVRGILVPIHPTAKVFAWRAGVVDALYVAEGQSVQKGQKLATVKAVPADRDGLVYTQEGAKSLSNEEALAWQRVDLATGKGEADLQRLRATVAGALRQHAQLKAQVAFHAELIVSAQTTYEQLKTLLEKGFVSKWTCNGFVPVTYLIMPPWPRMRAG